MHIFESILKSSVDEGVNFIKNCFIVVYKPYIG